MTHADSLIKRNRKSWHSIPGTEDRDLSMLKTSVLCCFFSILVLNLIAWTTRILDNISNGTCTIGLTTGFMFKEECIPVGCVPSAAVAICWWGTVCPGGVSAQRCVCLGGCLPRGQGCLLGCVWQTLPLWTEWQTLVKTLPCRNYAADGNKNWHVCSTEFSIFRYWLSRLHKYSYSYQSSDYKCIEINLNERDITDKTLIIIPGKRCLPKLWVEWYIQVWTDFINASQIHPSNTLWLRFKHFYSVTVTL